MAGHESDDESLSPQRFYQGYWKIDDEFLIDATGGVLHGGSSLWQYRAGQWELKKAGCEPGFERGSPPKEPGEFEGQLRRTPCRRIVAKG
jgi:hypothetical protein